MNKEQIQQAAIKHCEAENLDYYQSIQIINSPFPTVNVPLNEVLSKFLQSMIDQGEVAEKECHDKLIEMSDYQQNTITELILEKEQTKTDKLIDSDYQSEKDFLKSDAAQKLSETPLSMEYLHKLLRLHSEWEKENQFIVEPDRDDINDACNRAKWLMENRLFPSEEYGEDPEVCELYDIIEELQHTAIPANKISEPEKWIPISEYPFNGHRTKVLRWHKMWKCSIPVFYNNDNNKFTWMNADLSNRWLEESFEPYYMHQPPAPGEANTSKAMIWPDLLMYTAIGTGIVLFALNMRLLFGKKNK